MLNFNDMQSVGLKIDKTEQGFLKALDTIKPFKSTLATSMKVLESAVEDRKFTKDDTEEFMGLMFGPLAKNIAEAKAAVLEGKYKGNDDGSTAIHTMNMLETYQGFLSERIGQSMKLLEDYAGTGANIEINRLATLPILYLTYMGGSAKDKIPHKTAESHLLKREVKVRYYHLNGKKYRAPECFRDKEFLSEVLNSAHDEKYTKLDLSDTTKFANGTYKFGKLVEVNAGAQVTLKDGVTKTTSFSTVEGEELAERLYFKSQITHLEFLAADGTTKTLVKAPADLYGKDLFGGYVNRGRMQVDLVNPFTDKTGVLNIEFVPEAKSAKIAIGGEAQITGVVLKLWTRMYNQGLKNPVTNSIEKFNLEKEIRNGLRQEITYNEETKVIFNDLANIDILTEALAGMQELTVNVKDQMVFSDIERTDRELREVYAVSGAEVFEEWEIAAPGLIEGYMYQNLDFKEAGSDVKYTEGRTEYKFQRYFETLATAHDFFRHAAQSQDMISVWGMSHMASAFLTKQTPVFSQGSEVGGIKNVNTVYNIEQAGAVMRIVVSEREARMKQTNGGECEVIGYPIYNDNNLENKTFMQYWTFTAQPGSGYQSESHPFIPAIQSIDVFDIIDYQSIGAAVKMKNIIKG